MNPQRSPSAAGTRRPVSMRSSATLRGRSRATTAVIMNGQSPRLTSGIPISTSSAATTRSHASMSPNPPASAWPLTRATIGKRDFRIFANRSPTSARMKCCCTAPSEPIPPRSPPAQNALSPDPVRTTAWTASSLSAVVRLSAIPVTTSGLIALRRSGLSMVIVATFPETSKTTSLNRDPTSGYRARHVHHRLRSGSEEHRSDDLHRAHDGDSPRRASRLPQQCGV